MLEEKLASNLIKAELAKKGISYDELCIRLNKMGVNENRKTLTQKLWRGKFTFLFALECLRAIEVRELNISEIYNDAHSKTDKATKKSKPSSKKIQK